MFYINYDDFDEDRFDLFDEEYFIRVDENKEKKCECGGEKANTTHSDWCPKYKEE